MSSRYTSLGTSLWTWRRWTKLGTDSRLLWLALYTGQSAKRLPPGLFTGSVNVMAEESSMDGDVVRACLDDLRGANLIEWDQERRLVRLTEFPDAHERATNPSHLRGWWNSFRTIEECPLRDSHVTTLRWLLDQGVITEKMEEAWADTFGHPTRGVKAPPTKKRERRDPVLAQSSLFPLIEPLNPTSERDQLDPTPSGTPCRQGVDQDQDQDQVFSSFGRQGEPPVDLERPRLTLVPMPTRAVGQGMEPFTPDDLAEVFGGRRTPWPLGMQERLSAAICHLGGQSDVTRDDLALLREAIAAGVMPEIYLETLPDPQDATDSVPTGSAPGKSTTRRHVGWDRVFAMTDPDFLLATFHKARERSARIAQQRKDLAEIREKAGI